MLYCLKCDHLLPREDALEAIGPEAVNRAFPPHLNRKAIPADSICAIANEAEVICPECGAKAAWTGQRRDAGR
jgi:hypothetical protein